MRIAVLGSTGLLGRQVVRACAERGLECVPFHHAHEEWGTDGRTDGIEVISPDTEDKILACEPHAVVNCTAFHNVAACEEDSASAFAINSMAPGRMARVFAPNIRLIHVSTDYVFGATPPRAPEGYCETDLPGPLNTYGASKLAGEHLVLAASPRHIVVRTSALYGPGGSEAKGGCFPDRMLALAREGKPLRVVSDQVTCPTYAADLANVIIDLLERDPGLVGGLYHLAGTDAISWYGFAVATLRLAGYAQTLEAVTTAELDSKVCRPLRSVLRTERARPLAGWTQRLAPHVAGLGQ